MGGLGERKKEGDIDASTEELVVRKARAQSSTWLTLPEGQYRTVMPRGPSPVLVLHLAVVVETFHVAAVTHMRSPSLVAAAARGAAPSPPRLSLLLSLLRKAPPVLHLWLQAPVSRAHTHA